MAKRIQNYVSIKTAKYDLKPLREAFEKESKKKEFDVDVVWETLDKASANENWRNQFVRTFSILQFGKVNQEFISKFRAFTEDEKDEIKAQHASVTFDGQVETDSVKKYAKAMKEARKETTTEARVAKFTSLTKKKYDVDSDAVLETNVLPLLDGLIATSPILERVNIISGVDYKKLIEFDVEKDAETLTNTNAGTEADDVIRTSLTLDTSDKKIQASTTINDTDLESLDASEWARFVFRLVNRVRVLAETQILYGDGTSNGFLRGFINTAGSTDAERIGAIEVDVSGGGDIIEKMKLMDKDLPKTISSQEESQYSFIGNRKLQQTLKLAKDADGRYYFTDGQSLSVNTFPVLNSPSVTTGDLLLVALPQYTMITRGSGVSLLNDGGVVELKEGNIIYVAKMKADGCPRMAFKYLNTGSTTSGDATNQDRNYHRYAENAYN